mgnify:CR=1 FL=1
MRLPSVLAHFTSCLLLSANVTANFYDGLAAYETDDYETAVREWKASAEQGRHPLFVVLGQEGRIWVRNRPET